MKRGVTQCLGKCLGKPLTLRRPVGASFLPLVPFLALGLVVSLSLLGCTDFKDWDKDTPSTRELQKKSLEGLSAAPIAGESIEEFFRDRVGLIASSRTGFPSGRAVPLSTDGYFLTAWHVVDEGKFYLSDFVQLKPLPEGVVFQAKDYYRVDKHLGRVVWYDEKVDLAIVKFDFETRAEHVFKLAGYESAAGVAVFSASVGTNSGTLLITEKVEDGIGNGPYQTAGVVLNRRKVEASYPAIIYRSSLVARGGMSGGPAVDEAGNLIGIITRIHSVLYHAPTTSFAMLRAQDIAGIVAADRQGRE